MALWKLFSRYSQCAFWHQVRGHSFAMQEYQLHGPKMVLDDHPVNCLALLELFSRGLWEKWFSQCLPRVGDLVQTCFGGIGRHSKIKQISRNVRLAGGKLNIRDIVRDKEYFKY